MPTSLTSPVVAAIPVKPFGQAKRRLSDVLQADQRRALGKELALRTIAVVRVAGVVPIVLSADDEVTVWARDEGVRVLLDEGSSLDRAATVARDDLLAEGSGWMIVHADLPILSASEVRDAAELVAAGRSVIAPSSDGGTSMIGSVERIEFAYGPGSFHRHLAAMARFDPKVVTSIGWALDLDTPADLEAALAHPLGRWLSRIRPGGGTPPSDPV